MRPTLKVVLDADAPNEVAGGSPHVEIMRDGAQQMPAAALQAEVAADDEAFADETDDNGPRLWSATAITISVR